MIQIPPQNMAVPTAERFISHLGLNRISQPPLWFNLKALSNTSARQLVVELEMCCR